MRQSAVHDLWNYTRWFPYVIDRAAAFLKGPFGKTT
jgi:hypothetical protein